MKRLLLLILLTLLFVGTACSADEIEPVAVPTATEVNIEATEAPVEATEVSVQPTLAPVEATEVSVQPTEAPAEATSAPAQATEVSVEATSAPAEATSPPVQATNLSEQGPWLVFRNHDDVNEHLWVANSDGSAITLIAERVVAPYDFSAITSPSQQHIAFITADDNRYNRLHGLTINVVALPSLQVVLSQPLTSPATEPPPDAEPFDPNVQIVRTFVEVSSFAWSPDGRQLAYMGAHDGPSGDLYVFSLDTGQITRLTDGPTEGIKPYWSPDGNYIVHAGVTTLGSGAGYGMVAVWAAAVDGSEILTLYDASRSAEESFLGWLSDETVIVYSANAVCGHHTLRTFNLQTSEERILWPYPLNPYGVAFDPISGLILIASPNGNYDGFEAPCSPPKLSGLVMIDANSQESSAVAEMELFELTWFPEAGLFQGRNGDNYFSITTDGQISQLDAPLDHLPLPQALESFEYHIRDMLLLAPSKATVDDNPTPAPPSETETGEPSSDVAAQLLAEGYQESGRQVVSTETAIYEAVLYKHPSPQGDHLLIYKEQAGQKSLLYQQANEFERIDFSSYTLGKGKVTGWHNMNGDGWQLELPILVYNGGNCWICTQLQVIQLQPLDDKVVNLVESAFTPAERNGFAVKELLDLNGDGIAEWRILDTRYEFGFNLCHACSPWASRIYAWDGETYRNASAQFPDYYQPEIDRLTDLLEALSQSGQWDRAEGLGPLISLLLNYENAGRLEEGWPVFSSYANPERYTQISEADAAELIEIREQFRQEYGFPAD